jgi:phage protein
MTCPGSVAAVAAAPVDDTPSEAAAEGTAAHALAEILLRERIELKGQGALLKGWKAEYGEKYNANELKAGVMPYVNKVSDAWEELGGRKHARLLLEQRVFVIEGVYGTADAVVISDKGVLHVLDLKFGRGVRVEAEDNPQLRCYALGALQDAELEQDVHEVQMTIVQPRHKDGGHISTAVMTAEALHSWGEELKAAAEATKAEDAPRVPSEGGCLFCPAAPWCPERAEFVAKAVGLDASTGLTSDPVNYSSAALAEAMGNVEAVEGWCKAVRREALRQAGTEEGLPGWHLKPGRTRRSVTAEAAQALVDFGLLSEDEAFTRSPATLSKLETAAGGRKALDAAVGDLLKLSTSAPTLAKDE